MSAVKVRQVVLNLLAVAMLMSSFENRSLTAAQIIPVEQECSDDMYFNTAFYSCQMCGTDAIQSPASSKSN